MRPTFMRYAFLPLFLGACEDKDHDHTHDDDGGEELSDAVPYTEGMTATTDSGHHEIALTLSGDGVHGEQDVTLEITHHGSAVFVDDITLEAFMPAHGHGTNAVTVQEGSMAGVYTAADLDLMMPGAWELTIEIEDDGHGGTAVFVVDLE